MQNQTPRTRDDLHFLRQMADRARVLLEEFDDLSPEERVYACEFVLEFERLVQDFRRRMAGN